MITPHKTAILALKLGYSPVPPAQDGSKRPLPGGSPQWERYRTTPATIDEINSWYATGITGMGLAAGYGNLQVIDFDDRGSLVQFEQLCDEAGLGGLLDLIKDGYFEHSPNGAHLLYKCSDVQSRKVLAARPWTTDAGEPRVKPLIETVNYIVAAPSFGGVNKSGDYKMISGGLDTIVEISPEDRDDLHDIARVLDERPKKPETKKTTATFEYDGDKPGDAYNRETSWPEILEPHGWVRVLSRSGVTMWRRPGKEHGISATTNHKGNDLFHVFSSSTCFESDESVSKFKAYTILNHGGDYSEAARQLHLLGYGQKIEIPNQEVDLSLIMAKFTKPVEPRSSFDSLLRVPGLVGELAEWINSSSVRPQPILALGASIAAMATILGRKVQTATGLRTNVYILGVGETGCGKERARQAIKKLFSSIDAEKQIGESFASDSAVETAVIDNPSCLYLIDELGHFLGTIKNDQTPSYVRSILPILLRMYSASEGSYVRRTYAKADENEKKSVEQPCLSIYGTTVPRNLYKSLTKEHASDGFLSRLLVFDSGDPDPHIRLPDQESRKVPNGLAAGFAHWNDAAINPCAIGNLESFSPDPLVVEATKRAWAVFDGLELRMRAKRKAVREAGGDQGPYTRVWATAQKLALIRACGIRLETPEITEADAQWGCDLAWLLTDQFINKIQDVVVENKVEDICNRIGGLIREAGNGGLSRRDLTRGARWASPKERADAIATLVEGGHVGVDEIKTSGRGPTKTVYRWL
jgi:hypothetical protein